MQTPTLPPHFSQYQALVDEWYNSPMDADPEEWGDRLYEACGEDFDTYEQVCMAADLA